MSVEENKAILKKLSEEIAKGNENAFDEAFAPSIAHHWSDGKPQVKNFEEMKKMFNSGLGKAAPTVDEMMAEGDRIAVWYSYGDRHGCWIYRFSDGKIVESWNMVSIQRNGEPGYYT